MGFQQVTDPSVLNDGGVQTDWWTQNAPPGGGGDGGAAPADDFAQQLTALYARYGRPAPDAATIAAHRQNPGGLSAVEQQLQKDNTAGGLSATPQAPAASAANPAGRTDRGAILSQISQWAQMPGADPSLASNPNYWADRIIEKGGLGADNTQYWQDASVGPTAFFNNPGRESGGPPNQVGFGAPPNPYASNPNAPTPPDAPAVPASLANPYAPATWTGTAPTAPNFTPFVKPTQSDLENSPGYLSRLTAGVRAGDMSAAAHGSVLNGGTQKATNRYAQDYASNEYGNLFNQDLTLNQVNNGYLQTGFNDASGAYATDLNQFNVGNQASFAARQQTQNEFQQNVVAPTQTAFQNKYASYLNDNARTLQDYLTNYNVQHTADTDYWGRLKDVSNSGLTAALGDRAA